MSETIGLHQGPADGTHAPGGPTAPPYVTRDEAVYVLTLGGLPGHDPDWHYCHRPRLRPPVQPST